jgi:hypothetical protein
VNDLNKSQRPIEDVPALYESSLVRADDSVGHRVKPCRVCLGHNLENDIDECYWSKLGDLISSRDLGDEGKDTKIEAGNVYAPQHKVIENV